MMRSDLGPGNCKCGFTKCRTQCGYIRMFVLAVAVKFTGTPDLHRLVASTRTVSPRDRPNQR